MKGRLAAAAVVDGFAAVLAPLEADEACAPGHHMLVFDNHITMILSSEVRRKRQRTYPI